MIQKFLSSNKHDLLMISGLIRALYVIYFALLSLPKQWLTVYKAKMYNCDYVDMLIEFLLNYNSSFDEI